MAHQKDIYLLLCGHGLNCHGRINKSPQVQAEANNEKTVKQTFCEGRRKIIQNIFEATVYSCPENDNYENGTWDRKITRTNKYKEIKVGGGGGGPNKRE